MLRPWETLDDEHEHTEHKVTRPPPPLAHVPATGEYARLGNEETDMFKQARKRVRPGDRGLIEEQQTVHVTTVVTVWLRSSGADDSYSASATPEATKETNSVASEEGGATSRGQSCTRDVTNA